MGTKEKSSRKLLQKHYEDSLRRRLVLSVSRDKEKIRLRERQRSEALLLGLMVLFIAMIVAYAYIASGGQGHGNDIFVSVSFVVNGIMGIVFLVRSSQRHAYSIEIAHWVFFILFFSLAPFLQYQNGSYPWSWTFDNSTIVMGNGLVFFWGLIVGFICNRKRVERPSVTEYPKVAKSLLIVMLGISALVLVYMIATIGLSDMLSRSTNDIEIESSAIRQLVEKTCRATVTFTCVVSIIYFKRSHSGLAFVVISLVICVVACAPTGMPRYSAAAIWGCILLASLNSYNKKVVFPLMFFVALLVVFPAINVFKGVDISSADIVGSLISTLGSIPTILLEVSYDTYSILLRTIDYVNTYGISFGYQLLGAVLFFVPRSFWVSKPFGSGATVVASQGQTVTNVACPLPGEGVINFGIVGFFLFAVLAGFFIARCDRKYWCSTRRSLFLQIFYPQLIFFFFFIMRGDLMSSLAYTVAFGATNLVWATINNWLLSGSARSISDRFGFAKGSETAVK